HAKKSPAAKATKSQGRWGGRIAMTGAEHQHPASASIARVNRSDRGRCTTSAYAGTDLKPKRVTRAAGVSTWTERVIPITSSRSRTGPLAGGRGCRPAGGIKGGNSRCRLGG